MNHIKNFNETLRTLRSSKRSALSDISNNELKKKDNIMKETKFEEVSKPDIVKPKRMVFETFYTWLIFAEKLFYYLENKS